MNLLKKKIMYTTVFICLLAIAVFSSIKFTNVDAKSGKGYAQYKYYTSYEIQPGDTLTSIAQEYTKNSDVKTADYIKEIMKDNNLSSDNITAGKNIIITYYSFEQK